MKMIKNVACLNSLYSYLPTHIKFLTEFHRFFFGTTCISFLSFFESVWVFCDGGWGDWGELGKN